jgi:hypothetical protein
MLILELILDMNRHQNRSDPESAQNRVPPPEEELARIGSESTSELASVIVTTPHPEIITII